jgi:hypothetical protein
MDEKARFKFDSALEQPPHWMDPDKISDEMAAANAASWDAAASAGGQGVRSRM